QHSKTLAPGSANVCRQGLFAIVFLGFCHPTGPAVAAADPAGNWVGRCRIDGADVFVRLGLKSERAGWRGTAFSRRLGARNAPRSEVHFDGTDVVLGFEAPGGTVRLSCRVGEDALDGTVACGRSGGPCAFRRLYKLDKSALEAFRGDYQVGPDRVLLLW